MIDESQADGVRGLQADEAPESDSSLLRRIAQGDEKAMTPLYERYSGLVYSVSLRVLRDQAQAEDVVQDVFMQMWSKPLSLNPTRENLGPLLAVITRNRSIDLLRGRRQTESSDDVQLASSFNLEGTAEHHILLDRVRRVAETLPMEQKTALDLAFFEGLTHAEIAEKTGTPLGTIKTRIRAALHLLERTLRP